jgi:NADP-dependent 3-hydroxy acid dehydrogenase YdfG
MRLKNKVAIITGAAHGMGAAWIDQRETRHASSRMMSSRIQRLCRCVS